MASTSGCETARYYGQAIAGQWQILSLRQPIARLLADTNTPPDLRRQLQLVMRLRAFAQHELKLPVDGHYDRYADVRRPYVVWNVYAAPELSLAAKSWWYPFVGSLEYRGYFAEAPAHRHAERLRARGFDVFVAGIEAYSTLGWFEDPILNTFVFDEEHQLADLLFHELAHQRVFLRGDTDFNEAFATAVAEEGVRRWVAARADRAARRRHEEARQRHAQFVHLVLRARRELETLYGEAAEARQAHASTTPPPPDIRRASKAAIIARLRQDYQALKAQWGGYTGYDTWFDSPINNAQINTVATYYDLVPGFHALLARCGGELEAFYREAERLRKLPEKERHQWLRALASEATAATSSADAPTPTSSSP
ncbi:MAG TPA: aminopeptidase [Methylomirabilota bacterium]|nr:aminopeptidase [Methylomirabilota bacterium]